STSLTTSRMSAPAKLSVTSPDFSLVTLARCGAAGGSSCSRPRTTTGAKVGFQALPAGITATPRPGSGLLGGMVSGALALGGGSAGSPDSDTVNPACPSHAANAKRQPTTPDSLRHRIGIKRTP